MVIVIGNGSGDSGGSVVIVALMPAHLARECFLPQQGSTRCQKAHPSRGPWFVRIVPRARPVLQNPKTLPGLRQRMGKFYGESPASYSPHDASPSRQKNTLEFQRMPGRDGLETKTVCQACLCSGCYLRLWTLRLRALGFRMVLNRGLWFA